jgi:endonuclease-3
MQHIINLMTPKEKVRKIIKILKKLFPQTQSALNYRTPWQFLVAVQLSAQCTDKKVNEVTAKLFKKYPSLDAYVRARPREFEKDIHATGFYRSKTRNILAAAKAVKTRFGGKLPRTMAEMVTLPGMGRKSANIVLGTIYGVSEGIAVDTHVKRLARKLGLTKHTDPVKIERDLMEIVPRKEWRDFNFRLVDYGRKYCPARPHSHKEKECPLAELYTG